jgi:hypothetical protein
MGPEPSVTKRYKVAASRNIAAKDGVQGVSHPVRSAAPNHSNKKEHLMKTVLASASLAALLGLASMPAANAWTRSGSVTTWRGTYHGSASGGCGAGSCWRSASVTGPYGGTVSRSGNISHVGPHTYAYSRTTTGPDGNSITRSRTVTRYPYDGYRY